MQSVVLCRCNAEIRSGRNIISSHSLLTKCDFFRISSIYRTNDERFLQMTTQPHHQRHPYCLYFIMQSLPISSWNTNIHPAETFDWRVYVWLEIGDANYFKRYSAGSGDKNSARPSKKRAERSRNTRSLPLDPYKTSLTPTTTAPTHSQNFSSCLPNSNAMQPQPLLPT